MNKQKLIELIKLMICDKNRMLNYGKGNATQIYAWEYTRNDLEFILNFVKELD